MRPDDKTPDDAGWPDAIDRYFGGDGGSAEAAAYVREHPRTREFFEALHEALNARPAQTQASFDAAAGLARIVCHEAEQGVLPRTPSTGWRGASGTIDGRARGLLGTLGVGARPLSSWRVFAAAAIGASVALYVGVRWVTRSVTETPARTYATVAGQRATITLPDSTRVTLAPQTTLTVASDFGRTHRAVTLRGEAYFDVAHTAGHPFLVRTDRIVTRVLGTAFDVTHYADDRDVRVAVSSGRVAVATPRRTVATLVAGMVGRVTDSTALVTVAGDRETVPAWTHGTLEFHNAPVPEMLQTVGRWYGVRFELADSVLATHRVTTFLDYTNTNDLIVTLETVLNVSATSVTTPSGQVVTLRPRQESRRPAPRHQPQTLSPNTEVGR